MILLRPLILVAGLLASLGAAPSARAETRTVLTGTIAPTYAGGAGPRVGTVMRTELTAEERAAPQPVHFALRLRNYAELAARVQRGEVLTLAEMTERYFPTEETWRGVADWAATQGLAVRAADPSRMTVIAESPVATAETALQTRFARVRGTDGAEHTSAILPPSLPEELAGAVAGVLELQPHLRARPRQTITPVTVNGGYISPKTIAQLYNAADVGLDGTGETIVILGSATVNPADLTAFWAASGLATTTAQFTQVDTLPGITPGANSGAYEETMDLAWASAMAPKAKLIYLPTISPGVLSTWLFARMASDTTIHQVSTSFAVNEATDPGGAALQAYSQYYAAMSAVGVSFFAASGDSGSTADVVGNQVVNDGFAPNGVTAPEYPASDPFVTAVGGTMIGFATSRGAAALPVTEGAWCLPNGLPLSALTGYRASGGGVSGVFARPAWQAGAGVPAGTMRCVPDVAAMAAGNFPAFYVFQGQMSPAGGTSLSAPIWTGLCALLNQARARAGLTPLGLPGPKFYPLMGTAAFNAMTVGAQSAADGFSTTARNGAYTVGANYNLVAGLGSPDIGVLAAALTAPLSITTQPVSQNVDQGGTVSFVVAASGGAGAAPTWQWWRNGVDLAGATGATLTRGNVQPADTGLYAAVATNGAAAATSRAAALGIVTKEKQKVIGAGEEVAANIYLAANGNTFDQVLLKGAAATVTADDSRDPALNQITRLSFVDLDDDIVQVEFSGPGTLSLVLDGATGPAEPVKYNQTVSYMKGHAGIVITGATEQTNVAVFSVGRITAVDQALFKAGTSYDGVADIAFIAIASANGRFGGVRTANTHYFSAAGLTGVYAPGVTLAGPVYVGNITAFDGATPVIQVGAVSDARITGGDLAQANGAAVQVSGLTHLQFTAGTDSHGNRLPARTNRAVLRQDGADVTAQIVVNPGP